MKQQYLCIGGYEDGQLINDQGQYAIVENLSEAPRYACDDYECCNPDTVSYKQERYIKECLHFQGDQKIYFYRADGMSPFDAITRVLKEYAP